MRMHAVGLLGVAAGIAVSVAPAQAAIPAGNQIRNPDAETGAGSNDSSTQSPSPIPEWTTSPNFTEHLYDPQGSTDFPDTDDSAAINGGKQMFAGGPSTNGDNTTETAAQDVDVSGAAAEIDAGGVSATLAADLGGFSAQEDNATITATFLNAGGQDVGHLTIGPVTATDRGSQTSLLARTTSGTVPVGTRKVHVLITATKTEGDYNDGYIDNVSLTFAASQQNGGGGQNGGGNPPPTTTGPAGNPLGLPAPHGCVDTRKFSFKLHHAPTARIVKVEVFINGKRTVVKTGSNITRLTLKRLPKKKFVVKIVATQDSGSQLISKRTYKGCKKTRSRTHAHHHG
jgi:hypothetical protein